ncbi:MAG: peptidyl-tRNA hydrolase Pth2 [Nanoarchaeota archaeon]|nr:peptidyl-tRNA hydrolase Pth2 [Nanoarchaeota archaeon]
MAFKQVVLVRSDLKLSPGKLAAQCGHGFVESFVRADDKVKKKWLLEGAKKVVLKVPDERSLKMFFAEAQLQGLPCALINDAGHTELPPNTLTVVGLGPAEEERLDKLTGQLKML